MESFVACQIIQNLFQLIAIAYVLFTRESAKSYQSVWTFVFEKYPHLKPLQVISSYDKMIHRSLKAACPQLQVFGSYWAYVKVRGSGEK